MKSAFSLGLLFVCTFFLYTVTLAQRVNPGSEETVQFDIIRSDMNGFSYRVTFPEPSFHLRGKGEKNYYQLTIPGCYPAVSQGKPNLPLWNRIMEIPLNSTFSVTLSDVETVPLTVPTAFSGMELIPVQPPRPKQKSEALPFIKDPVAYSKDDWFGYGFVNIKDDGVMRNARIARLSLSPVEYHPVTRQLRYIKTATVAISFNYLQQADPVGWKASFCSPFMDGSAGTLNENIFVPPPQPVQHPVRYVILSDPMFQAALQPFIQWKKEKGFEVIEVYKGAAGVGSTASSMKAYLQSIYNASTPSNPAPTFLLIVGDVQQIPSFNGNTGALCTDLYYAEYTNDIYPELYYGRFSATNLTQLQPQIDKTLLVERYLMASPSYLENAILVAGNDASHAPIWANGQMHYAEDEYVNPSNNIIPHTYLYPTSSSQTSQIIQRFNMGAGFVNYSAHGSTSGWADPAFTSTTVGTLTNAEKYPIVISNACETNQFSINQCFGEALLRAQDKGAVGAIGASDLTYWDEDYYFSVGLVGSIILYPTYSQSGPGFYDRLFHTHGEAYPEWAVTQGSIIHSGNLAVTQSGSLVEYYWEIYHLMGDPSLMPYLGVPSSLNPIFPQSLPTGLTQVTIQTDPYCYVALSANNALHGAGLTDANGMISLSIQPVSQPVTAKLVITGQNRIPYIDSIIFTTPAGPYVLADSVAYHDTAGNNDLQIDAGEIIQMDVRFRNYTSFNAGLLTARFICQDPFITVTDSLFSISSLAGLNVLIGTAAFTFQVADFVPDLHFVSGLIRIDDGASNVWSVPVGFFINSPDIRIHQVYLSDHTGNGNGKIEPGEDFEFIVRIQNRGHATLHALDVSLEQNSNYIQLNNPNKVLPVFLAGQYYEVSFPAKALAYPIPKGSVVRITAKSSQNNYADSLTTYKMLDPVLEDFESNGFTTFDWVLTGSQPWFTSTLLPYEGTTCAQSGAIPNQSSTSMSLQFPVISKDSIYFVYKVSSEENYDCLRFMIDNQEVGKWSGEQMTWTWVKFPVDSGLCTFTWTYEKDYYWEEGQDCAWIDYIIFPPTSLYMPVQQPEGTPPAVFIHPNPTSGSIHIRLSGESTTKMNITLFRQDGQIIEQQVIPEAHESTEINLQPFASGVYFLMIETPTGNQTRKIIKY